MGFIGSMLDSSRGAGFEAQQDPNAINNLQNQQAQEGQLANQLMQQSQGGGPNIAGQQLQLATNQNIANASGILSSAKGLNPALAARLAAQQGGQLGQEAAGQSAITAGQQQLAAQQQLGQLNLGQQGVIQGGINNANSANSGIAANNQKAQAGLTGAISGALNMAHGGMVPHYDEGGDVDAPAPGSVDVKKLIPLLSMFLAKGGVVPQHLQHLAGGGTAGFSPNPFMSANNGAGYQSAAGQYLSGQNVSVPQNQYDQNNPWSNIGKSASKFGKKMFNSAPEKPIPGSQASDYTNLPDQGMMNNAEDYKNLPDVSNGADIGNDAASFGSDAGTVSGLAGDMDSLGNMAAHGGIAMRGGGKVPGRAKIANDSYSNDTVDAKLSPGEIVIPRHITTHANAPEMAAAFVREALAKKKMGIDASGVKKFADEDAEVGDDEGEAATPPPPQSEVANAAPAGGEIGFSPQAIPAASQPGSTSGTASNMNPEMVKQLENSFGEQRKGIMEGAKAQGDLGKSQSDIYNQSIADLKAQDQNTQSQFRDIDKERQGLLHDIQNGKIDPNHYVGSMGLGQKVSTAIGLILGGIGSGMNGGPNPGVQFLQNHIDADIRAQEEQLGNKKTLLAANMQHFAQVKDAAAVTRANMLDMASLGLKNAAAKSMDPMARARALQAAGALDQAAAQTVAPIKFKQQVLQGIGNGTVDPSRAINMIVEPGQRAKAIDEAGKAQYVAQNKEHIMKLWDQANAEQDSTSGKTIGGIRTGAARNALELAVNPLIKTEMGRVNPIVKGDFTNNMPSSFTSKGSLATRRAAFENAVDSQASTPTLKANGIDLSKYKQYNTSGPKYSPGDVVFVKGKGNFKVGPDGNSLVAVQ